MAKLIFSLRNVPEDEAEDVRALLNEHGIEFYETSAGNWGIAVPAIWLKHKADYDRARSLIDAYQDERFATQRALFEQSRREGKHRTLLDIIRENPFRFILYIAFILILLYFSIKPFLHLK
jgi:hypothetical protein